jgi:hypothetical protein
VVLLNEEDVSILFKDIFFELSDGKSASFIVKYYNYAGLKSTIKLQNSRFLKLNKIDCGEVFFLVKLSPGFKEFSETFYKALGYVLISKIIRKKCPSYYKKIYKKWINLKSSEDLHKNLCKLNGNTIKNNFEGEVYNLKDSFERINNEYFEDVLALPILKWGSIKTCRKFGHYDFVNHVIHISKSLDSLKVPLFVLDYVMYHEMLHIYFGFKVTKYNRISHTKEFKEREKLFFKYYEACLELNKLSVRLKKSKLIKNNFIKNKKGFFKKLFGFLFFCII